MFFFNENCELHFKPLSIEHAYLNLLNNDIDAAKLIFQNIDSPRAKWGLVLVDILNGYVQNFPTYFQIRNFLEIDLDFLIKNEKNDYVELVLGASEFLSTLNNECYKYIARVLLENKFYNVSFNYLEKSKCLFYRDPELHFLYSKYYVKKGDYTQADYYINECLKILPDDYPAKIFKKAILLNLDNYNN